MVRKAFALHGFHFGRYLVSPNAEPFCQYGSHVIPRQARHIQSRTLTRQRSRFFNESPPPLMALFSVLRPVSRVAPRYRSRCLLRIPRLPLLSPSFVHNRPRNSVSLHPRFCARHALGPKTCLGILSAVESVRRLLLPTLPAHHRQRRVAHLILALIALGTFVSGARAA